MMPHDVTRYQQFVKWAAVANKGSGDNAAALAVAYPVTHVYVWSVASWDVCGVYCPDAGCKETFRVPEACSVIQDWNDRSTVPG